MAPGVSSTLLERLRRCRAEAVVASGPLPMRALQAELAAIPVESTRDGAMRRFHILLVCASVMRRDPANFNRAVGKAYESLINFLITGTAAESKPPARKSSSPPVPVRAPEQPELIADAAASSAAVASVPPTLGEFAPGESASPGPSDPVLSGQFRSGPTLP